MSVKLRTGGKGGRSMRSLFGLRAILAPLLANYVCPFLQLWFLDIISVNLAAKTLA